MNLKTKQNKKEDKIKHLQINKAGAVYHPETYWKGTSGRFTSRRKMILERQLEMHEGIVGR